MKQFTFAIVLLILLSSTCFGQQRMISCSSERNADNSVSIIANCQEYGEYTIKLIFSTLSGYRTTPSMMGNKIATTTIENGKREIMKLTMDKISGNYQFQYSYTYYPGRALKKTPDSAFAYLLPSTVGNSLRTFPVTSISQRLQLKNKDDYFYSSGFIYKLGDTICAARAGLISDCLDEVAQGETNDQVYKSFRNHIQVQHKDGTLDKYEFVAPIKLLVKTGDDVYPGQPIAIFNRESTRYYMLFSIYYLDQNKVISTNIYDGPPPSSYVYLPTHFYCIENDRAVTLEPGKVYTAQHPRGIIVAELSKREKKKWGFD